VLWTQEFRDSGQAGELQASFHSDVQLQNVEAELYRHTLVISVRETPQLTLLHLQKKGTNQQHERFIFVVNTLPRNCNFV